MNKEELIWYSKFTYYSYGYIFMTIANSDYTPSPRVANPQLHSSQVASQPPISSSEGKAQSAFLTGLIQNVRQQGVDENPQTQGSSDRKVRYQGKQMSVHQMLASMKRTQARVQHERKMPIKEEVLKRLEGQALSLNINSKQQCTIL